MRKLFENIEKKIFIPAFLVLIVLTLTIYLFPGQVNGVISILFSLCTHELGWLFMLTCLASFGFMIWLTFSKYGKIKLGTKMKNHSTIICPGLRCCLQRGLEQVL